MENGLNLFSLFLVLTTTKNSVHQSHIHTPNCAHIYTLIHWSVGNLMLSSLPSGTSKLKLNLIPSDYRTTIIPEVKNSEYTLKPFIWILYLVMKLIQKFKLSFVLANHLITFPLSYFILSIAPLKFAHFNLFF